MSSKQDIDRKVIEAAVSLKRSAPEAWDRFLEALQLYSDGLNKDCVQSPVGALQVAQGRAQAIGILHGVLAVAHETADRIEQMRKTHERPSAARHSPGNSG